MELGGAVLFFSSVFCFSGSVWSVIFSDSGSFVAPCDGEKKVISFDSMAFQNWISLDHNFQVVFFGHNHNGFPRS